MSETLKCLAHTRSIALGNMRVWIRMLWMVAENYFRIANKTQTRVVSDCYCRRKGIGLRPEKEARTEYKKGEIKTEAYLDAIDPVDTEDRHEEDQGGGHACNDQCYGLPCPGV